MPTTGTTIASVVVVGFRADLAGPAPAPPVAAPPALSGREVEVLGLVASGLANRAIAERLFISPNTVANHVRSILVKTGCANRAEASAFAVRHGLVDAD